MPIDERWEAPLCACVRVVYSPDELDGKPSGRLRESWKCESCRTRFVHEFWMKQMESTLSATQRELERQQNGWIQCISDKSLVDFELSTTQREREELKVKLECAHREQFELNKQLTSARTLYNMCSQKRLEYKESIQSSQSRVAELEKALKDYVERCRCEGTGLYSYNEDVVAPTDCSACADAREALKPK